MKNKIKIIIRNHDIYILDKLLKEVYFLYKIIVYLFYKVSLQGFSFSSSIYPFSSLRNYTKITIGKNMIIADGNHKIEFLDTPMISQNLLQKDLL